MTTRAHPTAPPPRWLALLIVAVLGSVGSGTAFAGKPKIAILGLEVTDNGGGIEPATTAEAKELTLELRSRAKAGTGAYDLAKDSDKSLIDEKMINSCDNEAPTCMALIGDELKADFLMFGRIEKASAKGSAVYKVSLKLLNVNRKTFVSTTDELPLGATGVQVTTFAKNLYAKLAGPETTTGTLIVKANADRGTVKVDKEEKGSLSSGTLTVAGLSEGRHTLVIEAQGYQRYDATVTIRSGEASNHSAILEEISASPTDSPANTASSGGTIIEQSGTVSHTPTNPWKLAFAGSVVAAAGATGYLVYSWEKMNSAAGGIHGNSPDGGDFTPSDCGNDTALRAHDPNITLAAIHQACKYNNWRVYGIVATTAAGLAVVGTFVMAYMRKDGTETKVGLGHSKQRQFAITPIVSPEGGGATLQFDW